MKESLKQRNEAKEELLRFARYLFKSEKINKPLFNKMWNIASPASAYRLKSINDAIQTLRALNDENDDKTKKKDFTTIFKSVKKTPYYYKELANNTFKFYSKPDGNAILTVANKFYSNINYTLPKNHDYKNFSGEYKKTFNYKFDGEYSEILNFSNDIYSKQKFSFKINISFGFTLISESISQDKYYYTLISKPVTPDRYFFVKFRQFDATPNTRIFLYPVLIDNKRDITSVFDNILNINLIEKLTDLRPATDWRFYKFLYILFDVYQLKTTIGKINELPQHVKEILIINI